MGVSRIIKYYVLNTLQLLSKYNF